MPAVIAVRTHFSTQDVWLNPKSTGAAEGDHVVFATDRGTELGLVVSGPFEASKAQAKGRDVRPVLRVATDGDLEQAERLADMGEEAMPVFRRLVKESGLDMKPVGVEFLFGGERAVFYFAAEDRVDFRELVRELASAFHQRVDMRQIGVRDEARLQGGYAPCGQELCCVRFRGDFEPVSIRMAKEQDLPLNSSKISGVCGRLMCCLRYEFDAYRDFKQRAPKKNAVIDTPLGKAKVVEYNTPRETLTLRLENGKSFTIALKDMACSEQCRRRSEEQRIPLRPDTVTREALEQLGTADIAMQLADLDRALNPDAAYSLDDSLLDGRRAARRTHAGARGAGAEKSGASPAERQADGQASRRRRQARDQRGQAAEQAAGTAEGARGQAAPAGASPRKERQGQAAPAEPRQRPPRGGGMRPRRAGRASSAPTAQKAASGQGGEAQDARARQDRPAPEAAAAKPAPERRTRRHHAAAGQAAPAAQGAGQAAPSRRGGQDAHAPQEPPQAAGAQRRRTHRSSEDAGRAQAQGSGQAQAPRDGSPRRRRPGDHGGPPSHEPGGRE